MPGTIGAGHDDVPIDSAPLRRVAVGTGTRHHQTAGGEYTTVLNTAPPTLPSVVTGPATGRTR